MTVEASAPEQGGGRRIIDAHCHVASLRHTPRSFVTGSIDNMKVALEAQGVRMPPSMLADTFEKMMHDDDCHELIADMDEAGVAATVLLAPDFTYALKDCPLSIEETFADHARIRKLHPGRFEVLAGVDPRWGKDGVDLFERYVQDEDFAGLKLYPPCGYSPSSKDLFPYYEICAARNLPVLMHIGATSPCLAFDYGSPVLADEAFRSFPSVRFILAHAAVAYVEECMMMATYRPNVYVDVSGFQSSPDALGAIRSLAARGMNHKILFGTDWPVFRLQGRQKVFIDKALEGLADVPDRECDMIMHDNARRVFAEANAFRTHQ